MKYEIFPASLGGGFDYITGIGYSDDESYINNLIKLFNLDKEKFMKTYNKEFPKYGIKAADFALIEQEIYLGESMEVDGETFYKLFSYSERWE
jgi:hypothetical protein